jgi:hypothetical protein
LMITQFEATMQLESAAFVSLLILGCNFFLKGIIYAIRRHTRKLETSAELVPAKLPQEDYNEPDQASI